MVCKKYQVYDWFRTLDGAKRIDFLNGMLHLCFPLELRFLGSCIEELARKDYSYLRDAEIKANAASEIQLMRDIGDKVTRSKMIVTLALLASGNYECARYLYDLLNVDIMELLEKMKSCLDEKIADEFLLLLTMAANHPAFDFQMKTKMSQLYLNAEFKLKQNKILLKESESDLNLCNRADNEAITTEHVQPLNDQQSTEQSSSNLCNNPDLLLLKSTLNDIKNNINNTCKNTATTNEINNNLNRKKNRNKVEPVEVDALLNNLKSTLNLNDSKKSNEGETKTSQKNENETDDLPEEEKLNDSLIESINFEGVQTIKGTDCYKFIIKIQWSDKTFNEIDKTYSELCEFNKQLINLYPKELSGLMETSQLVLKENQKEDFVKELPLVTDYCSKIANLPKVVCESDFLRSFFRSNLSNSSITIANDSNSPNRQILTNNTSNKSSPSKQLTNSTEKKAKSVVKKLDVQDAGKPDDQKIPNTQKSENFDTQKKPPPSQSQAKPSSSEQSENSGSISTQLSSVLNESQASESKSNEAESSNKKTVNTNYTNSNIKTKNHAATVSVASIMNTDSQKPNKTSQKGNERINSSNDSSLRQNSMPPTINHQQMPPLPPNAQLLNYPPTIYNPNQMPPLNAQYPPGNYNQPLHLHTFQPINNMIIASPPCASPTTTTNPHSLNSSRSNSPWMMMPPPMPPVQQNMPPSQQGNIPNSGQQFYHQTQFQHPQGMHQNVRSISSSKNNSTSNLKDPKHTHFNNYYNSQDELLLRYALDNNNSHYNSNPNLQPPTGHSVEDSSHLNYSTLSLNERHNSGSRLGKMSENNLRKNSSKSKNIQHQNTSDSLLTTALTNTNNQYNNQSHINNNNTDPSTSTGPTAATSAYNGISSGSSSGAMSPKPVNESNTNNNLTANNANPNVRSSSSCSSSSYHQTPPPALPGQPPAALITNAQHVQQANQSQASASQHQNAHAAAIAAYNATLQQIAVAYQSQKLDQWGSQNPHGGNPPQIMPNHHLIPMTSSQIAALQQQQQLQHQPPPPNGPNNPHGSMPSLLLAPLMNSPNQNCIPVGYPPANYPPPPHGQQSNQKFSGNSSKQQFKNISVPPQERSNTPLNQQTNYLITSDDETIETNSQNGSKTNNLPDNRAHRKSIPNIANFPAKYMSRQHKSHSISLANPSTATSSSSTIQSSSGTSLKNSNQGSTNTLNNVQNSNNNSSSVSPQNPLNTVSSSIKKSTENITHSTYSPSQTNSLDSLKKQQPSVSEAPQMPSPKSQSKSRSSNRLSPTKEQPAEGAISVELTTQTEQTKENNTASNNGPFSSSSTSSSSSSISNNTQSKSPKSASNQQQQQQPSQQQQPAPVTQNNNMYYSSVVSNYPYIEGQNVYTLQNGSTAPNPNPNTQQQNTSLPPPPLTNQHNTMQPQFNNFSHPQPPPQGVQHQNAHPGYYVSLTPQQQQNYQATNGTSANTSASCVTPTPGSSPNTISNMPQQQQTTQPNSSANFNSNYNNHGSQQHGASNSQHPQIISTQQPPPSYIPNSQSMEPHHSINPYNLHHMMALVANNQQPQPPPVNGVPMQPMNPNMVMMMMMNPPPGHLPPGQLPPGQIVNSKHQYSNYQQFQPYRSINPTTLHQQQNSPSMGNNLLNFYQQQQHNSRKKVSCYNCGSMNHPPSECKEPTLESISQPTQFRLNFKVNNNQMSSIGSTNPTTTTSNQTNDSDDLTKNENNNLTAPTSYSKKNSAKNSISPNTNPALLTSSNFK